MELMTPLFLCALVLLPQALVLVLPRTFQALDINEAWKELQNLEEFNDTVHEKIEARPTADLFLLFTRRNQVLGEVLKYGDADSVMSSNFNANLPTMVVVHGWLENRLSNINPTLKKALLKHSDVNVIIMDWSRIARLDYVLAVRGVPSVGRGLGRFLAFLNQTTGMSYDTVHLIGFSLGGHVVGNAGRELNGQIARITALDPAGPLWYRNSERLRETDARYVEAIHTNAGSLGIEKAVGHADFFPNGGSSQPGCFNVACNHYRSYHLFAATVNKDHLMGRQCRSTVEFMANFCRGNSYPMGNNDLNKFGTGVYRLRTGAVHPYSTIGIF